MKRSVRMSENNFRETKFKKVITALCEYKGISEDELIELLNNKDSRYLIFLLLKRYKCVDFEMINKHLILSTRKSINYNLKKAEERFYLNKEFREKYFEADAVIKNNI